MTIRGVSERLGMRGAVFAVAALAALTGLSIVARTPDSGDESAEGAINTTVGHSAVSDEGPLDTTPPGLSVIIR